VLFSEEVERGGDAHRDQHHSPNRARSKDEQVSNRPVRVADSCKNEQGYCSGAGEPMNNAHHQGAKLLIETDPAKQSIEPGQGRLGMAVRVRVRRVPVSVAVYVVSMAVRMPMDDFRILGRNRTGGAHEARNIHDAKDNQHQSHGKLHGEPDSRGDYDIKKNDDGTHDKNRQGVSDTPENAGHRSFQQVALAAYDRGHRNHVVGIGGMAHPEKKSHRDNREKTDHRVRFRCLACCKRAQLVKAGGQKAKEFAHSAAVFGRQLEDGHARAHSLDITVRAMPVEFNRWGQVQQRRM